MYVVKGERAKSYGSEGIIFKCSERKEAKSYESEGIIYGCSEREGGKLRIRDYRNYRLNYKEKLCGFLITVGISGIISWLFYRSPYGMAGAIPLYMLVKKHLREYLLRRQRQQMLFQFREILQMTVAALKAGYAMENAFVEAWQEYVGLYGSKTIIAQEFRNINHKVQLNMPLEQLLDDFAQRSGIEEIISFAQVFGFAKRSGGDMMKIFYGTVDKIRQKSEVEREIETVVTAKRTEQRIMDFVPFGILFYVGATSPEFLTPLYGNLLGVSVMTVCLLGYLGAFFLAEKILDIQI